MTTTQSKKTQVKSSICVGSKNELDSSRSTGIQTVKAANNLRPKMTQLFMTPLYRKCSACHQEKYFKAMGLRLHPSGNKSCRSVCKVCSNALRKTKYYADHEESLRKVRARVQKRWPQILEYTRLWKAANPERRLKDDESYRQRRRQRETDQSDGTLTIPAMRKLFGLAKACPLCGEVFSKDKPKSLDHVVPLAKGGPHSISNVSVVCRPCNIKKADKELFLI